MPQILSRVAYALNAFNINTANNFTFHEIVVGVLWVGV